MLHAAELANLTWAMGVIGCESPEALTKAQQNNSVAATKHPCYRIQTKEVSQRLCLCCMACSRKVPRSQKAGGMAGEMSLLTGEILYIYNIHIYVC